MEAVKGSMWGNIVMEAVKSSIWGNIVMEALRVLSKVTLLWKQFYLR